MKIRHPPVNTKSNLEKCLLLMFESGFWCIFWLFYLVWMIIRSGILFFKYHKDVLLWKYIKNRKIVENASKTVTDSWLFHIDLLLLLNSYSCIFSRNISYKSLFIYIASYFIQTYTCLQKYNFRFPKNIWINHVIIRSNWKWSYWKAQQHDLEVTTERLPETE